MAILRRLALRLLNALRPARVEPDLAREIEAHLTLLADDFERRGLPREEARRAARRALAVEQVKDHHRDARSLVWLDDTLWDLKYALRQFSHEPGFVATTVFTLALAIGANAAVFTLVDATLFRGFPLVHDNDRLLYMTTSYSCCVSYPDFEDWRTQAKSFEGMALTHGLGVTFSAEHGVAERSFLTEVTADTFRLVGQQPVLGRAFTATDEAPGAPPVAILRHAFWERRFGRDPSVIGRTVRLNGIPTTVIGIMPPGFSFPQNQDMWVPLVATPEVRQRDVRNTWFAVGRLASGATLESARAEMDTIGRRLASAYPKTNTGVLPQVRAFDAFFLGPNARAIHAAMWGAVAFVLLIACANVANLLLARSIRRTREMSIRISLGAGRWRIVRQLVMESVLLCGAGGILGWWMARAAVRLYTWSLNGAAVTDWTGSWFDQVLDYSLDGRASGYLITITITAGILFGLAPARRLWTLDVNGPLKEGGRGAGHNAAGRRLSWMLVIAEMALAVVLLAAAGVMIRSFLNMYTADAGVETERLLTMRVVPSTALFDSPAAQVSFFDRVASRLEAIPGVESVAVASSIPGGGAGLTPYELDGAPLEGDRRPTLRTMVTGSGYFRTVGAALHAGREFTDADVATASPVVVVNQRFANESWPGEDPLGKRLRLFDGSGTEEWRTVIGVVSNIWQNSNALHQFDPLIYVPYRQRPAREMWLIGRTRVSPGSLASAFWQAAQEVDPELLISMNPLPLDQRLVPASPFKAFLTVLFLVLAGVALLLASVGLYAVVAHAVNARTQEIGVRTAMGATAGDILMLVFRQGLPPIGIGLGLGLAGSFVATPVLRSQLLAVAPSDPVALMLASAVLIVAAAVGCWIPARRAARVNPTVALRSE